MMESFSVESVVDLLLDSVLVADGIQAVNK